MCLSYVNLHGVTMYSYLKWRSLFGGLYTIEFQLTISCCIMKSCMRILAYAWGFGADEFVDLFFFYCDRFGKIWDLSLNLLNIYRVLYSYVSHHATLFDGLILCSKKIQTSFNVILLGCAWSIWKERNACVFAIRRFWSTMCLIRWKS